MDAKSVCERLKAGSAAMRELFSQQIEIAKSVGRPRLADYLTNMLHERVKEVPPEHADARNLRMEFILLTSCVEVHRQLSHEELGAEHPITVNFLRWEKESRSSMDSATTALGEWYKVDRT